MSGPTIEQPPYAEVQDPSFATTLQGISWQANEEFGGLVLQTACPKCTHPDGIDVFVPTVVAQFRADQQVAKELVTCACSHNHGAPAGKSGCGRWGYITPHVSQG